MCSSTLRSVWTLVVLVAWRLALENYHIPEETDSVTWTESLPVSARLRSLGCADMDGITEKRHVASSGKQRVLSKRIGNIPATGTTTLVALIGASGSSLSLLNWQRSSLKLAIIALITVFTKACHWGLSWDSSVEATFWCYLTIYAYLYNPKTMVKSFFSYFRGYVFVSELGDRPAWLKCFMFFSILRGK